MDTLRALRVLGLPPGSGPEEIKTAWRDLARVWHPDRFTHDERLQKKAGDNLQRINEAYEALRDYDPTVRPDVQADTLARVLYGKRNSGSLFSLRTGGRENR